MIFRQINREDLPRIMEWRNEQINILRQYKPLTMFNQEKWFEFISTNNSQIIFAIEDEHEDLIGYCGLVYIDWKNSKAELSMIFNTLMHHDMELHKKAIIKLLEYAFEEVSLNKVYVEFYEVRMEDYGKLIKELGFKHEGTLRQHHNYENSYIYSMLSSEWEAKNGTF